MPRSRRFCLSCQQGASDDHRTLETADPFPIVRRTIIAGIAVHERHTWHIPEDANATSQGTGK